MTIASAADLEVLFNSRSIYYGNDHADMDTMVNIYDGNIPAEYADMFHEEMNVHNINMIRLAWDDLAWMAGKEFPLYVRPDGNDATNKDRAERIEKWGYSINEAGRHAGGVSMKALMKVLMWWLIGCANAIAMVLPDYENKSPYFTFRDPRTHLPPVGWTPWNETKAEDAMFAYQKPLSQLIIEYPDKKDELLQAAGFGNAQSGSTGSSQLYTELGDVWMWVGEYYHADCWMVATMDNRPVELVKSVTGDAGHPGVQPVVSMGLYSATRSKGRSIFADQVSVQAAMARMFSQKLDFYDRTLYPLIFTTPLVGKTIKVGPYAVNQFDVTMGLNPRAEAIGPTNSVDADQTMQFAVGMSRMLNRNPESMQGAGEADSAKALAELRKGITDTVREGIWPAAIETLPTLYAAAAEMDQNLWGGTTKTSSGKRKNSEFQLTYRPRTLLKGRERKISVEPGVGLSGFQGTQELLMLLGAEAISEDDMLEQGEWVREASEAKKRIQGMRMEKLMWADLQARAGAQPGTPGKVRPGALSELWEMVLEKDMDLFAAIKKLDEGGRLYEEAPMPGDPLQALLAGGPPGAGGGAPGMEGILPPPEIAALGRGA